ncbi:ubiquinol-cytochrome c reductase iron-sulfur subunit, partial [Rhizobium ruizarguesonis]
LKKTKNQKFLLIASSVAAGIASVTASYSFLQQMMPDVTCYNDSIIDVNLSNILPGKALLVKWRGSVVVIKNRTQEEIDYA